MKVAIKTLGLLLLVGLFGSSCATVSRLNAEYEEETARIEQLSPEEKADLEKAEREEEKIDFKGFYGDAE